MKRRSYILYKDIQAIRAIKDPEQRAKACCEIGLSPHNSCHEAILRTCANGPGFHQTLARDLLDLRFGPEMHETLVAARAHQSPRSSNLPSEIGQVVSQRYEHQIGHEDLCVSDAAVAAKPQDLLNKLASATLGVGLAEMRGSGPAEDDIQFLDLVASISPEQREAIAKALCAMPPTELVDASSVLVVDRSPNLFRDFGIDTCGDEDPKGQTPQSDKSDAEA